MKYVVGSNKRANLDGPLRCPKCIAVLQTRLFELKDESEMLLLLDCPQGHVHVTLTEKDIVAAVSAEVWKRLSL